MSKIVINDLTDSLELDQQAMASIIGGATSTRQRQQMLLEKDARKRSSMRLMELARTRRFGPR